MVGPGCSGNTGQGGLDHPGSCGNTGHGTARGESQHWDALGTVLTITSHLSPCPSSIPCPTQLQPLFWAPIPPQAPGPASPAAPNPSRACDGCRRGTSARCSSLCVPVDSASPATALSQDRAAPVLTDPWQTPVPCGAGTASTKPAWGVHVTPLSSRK